MTRKVATLPPLAPTIPSMLGPVPTERVKDLRDKENGSCMGLFRAIERNVLIEDGMGPVPAWQTYWHEWAHIVLWDAGIGLEHAVEERVCDALATARVREMLDNGGKR